MFSFIAAVGGRSNRHCALNRSRVVTPVVGTVFYQVTAAVTADRRRANCRDVRSKPRLVCPRATSGSGWRESAGGRIVRNGGRGAREKRPLHTSYNEKYASVWEKTRFFESLRRKYASHECLP